MKLIIVYEWIFQIDVVKYNTLWIAYYVPNDEAYDNASVCQYFVGTLAEGATIGGEEMTVSPDQPDKTTAGACNFAIRWNSLVSLNLFTILWSNWHMP